MFIRSERLFLRPAWPEEWEDLLALINDEAVGRNLAAVPWPYTAEDARAFAARPSQKMLPHFFITLPAADGAKLIGSVGLAGNDGEVELGYWIARDHWGQGYATEAARAVLRLAPTLGHRRLVAHHFADNQASGRVLRKVGFRPTGEMRQRYCAGRGGAALALGHAVLLDGAFGGDDGAGDNDVAMRAA
jgi:RimJ/RimL family protein N-acetyltransferase